MTPPTHLYNMKNTHVQGSPLAPTENLNHKGGSDLCLLLPPSEENLSVPEGCFELSNSRWAILCFQF